MLDHQGLTLIVALLTIVVTVVQYVEIPKGFFPVQDTGQIQGITTAAQDISFTAMAQKQQALADVILKDKDVVKPVVLHRHGRHQHDAEQRANADYAEAA